MLADYLDMSDDDIADTLSKWKCKVDTGIEFDDIKKEFIAGNISEDETVRMRSKYGDIVEDQAEETIREWKCEKETGIAYSDVSEAFADGDISESEAKNIYITYGGLTEDEAFAKVRYLKVKKQFPTSYVDDAWVDEYYEEIEDSGISIEVFMDYRNKVKSIIGEGKKARRLDVIDSMPINDEQKDALYFAEGWAQSRIHEAPWH